MHVDRRLGGDLTQAMTVTRRHIADKSRFYSGLALTKNWIHDPAIETMATDGENIIYSDEFCRRIGYEKAAGVVVHELTHCTNLHFLRMDCRPLARWNKSTDLAINPTIIRAGWKLPDDLLFDRTGRFDFWTAEMIDRALAEEEAEQAKSKKQPDQNVPSGPGGNSQNSATSPNSSPQTAPPSGGTPPGNQKSGNHQPGQSQAQQQTRTGQAGQPQPSDQSQPSIRANEATTVPAAHWGEIRAPKTPNGTPMTPGQMQQAEQRYRMEIRQAAAAASRAGEDTGWVEEMLKAAFYRGTWENALAMTMNGLTQDISTWSRPNRRYIQSGIYMPGRIRTGSGCVVFVLDTSGSILASDLKRYAGAATRLIEETEPSDLIIVQCDSSVKHVQYLQTGETIDAIQLYGRGGTRFIPAFDWIRDNVDADAIIYATDLDSFDTPQDPGIPTIWLTTNNRRRVPFGEKIYLDN
jgi:predicted metal-dependent peptidase